MKKRVCIFCGSRTGNDTKLIGASEQLCLALAEAGYGLVYGGGKSGLMGVAADIFLEQKREVIGIRPKKLITNEDAHYGLSELLVVEDMFERKQKMMEKADIFISLPGGIGTLDELLEVFTHVKIEFIKPKLNIAFNVNNFYSGLHEMIMQMVKSDFLTEQDAELLYFENSVENILKRIQAFEAK